MKSNLDELFKTSKNQEREGNWFQLGECKFLIRRFGGFNSTEVKKSMAKYYKPYARQVELGTLAVEKEAEIMTKVFVYSSLIDWENIEINGEVKDFSHEAAIELLIELPDLLETLVKYSSDADSYKEELGN